MDHSSVVESTQRSYLNKSKDNIMKKYYIKSKTVGRSASWIRHKNHQKTL